MCCVELLALSDEWLTSRGVTQGASRKILGEVLRLGEQVAALRRLELLVLKGRLDAVPVALQTLTAALAIPFMSAPSLDLHLRSRTQGGQTRDAECSAPSAGSISNNNNSNNHNNSSNNHNNNSSLPAAAAAAAVAEPDAPKELLRHLFTDSVSDSDVATHFVRAMAKGTSEPVVMTNTDVFHFI